MPATGHLGGSIMLATGLYSVGKSAQDLVGKSQAYRHDHFNPLPPSRMSKQEVVLLPACYGPSVISVTVTKGGHLRGGGLYKTSGIMGRGVSQVT